MSLTGAPLIALAALATAALLAATVLTWNRGRRLRVPRRTAGILLTEAALVLTAGLVVNRSEQFYPTWAALLPSGGTAGTTFAAAPGALDPWLRAHAGTGTTAAVTFAWQPAGWAGWHLAAAPTVVAPAGYLTHPGWRYPAVLVVDDGRWTPAAEAAAARTAGLAAGDTVLVFARTTAGSAPALLGSVLPAALGRDVRVTGRRWALVSSAATAGLARRSIVAAPGRYATFAQVTAPPGGAGAIGRPGGAGATGRPGAVPLPAGITVDPAAGDLPAGLVWACEQTPPPLAASTPPTARVPVHHRRQRPHRRPPAAPTATVTAIGGPHVARQSRR